jgi:hypothetical protein
MACFNDRTCFDDSLGKKGVRLAHVPNGLFQLSDASFAHATSQPILDLRDTYAHLVREPFVRLRFIEEGRHLIYD